MIKIEHDTRPEDMLDILDGLIKKYDLPLVRRDVDERVEYLEPIEFFNEVAEKTGR